MVWKKFSQYLINKYLKNYIEQLDDEKLNFSLRNGARISVYFLIFIVILFTGNLLLENLRIKLNALVSSIDTFLSECIRLNLIGISKYTCHSSRGIYW